MTDPNNDPYIYKPKSNQRAKVRTIALLSAGSILGVGLFVTAATGLGGAPEEISILETSDEEGEREFERHGDRSDFGNPGEVRPEPGQFDIAKPGQDQPLGVEGDLPPIDAPGFAPRGEGHEDEFEEGGFEFGDEDDDDDYDHEDEDEDEGEDS